MLLTHVLTAPLVLTQPGGPRPWPDRSAAQHHCHISSQNKLDSCPAHTCLEALVHERRGLLLTHVGTVLLPHQRPRQVVAKACRQRTQPGRQGGDVIGRMGTVPFDHAQHLAFNGRLQAASMMLLSQWKTGNRSCYLSPATNLQSQPPAALRALFFQPPSRACRHVLVSVVGANHAHGAQEGLAAMEAANNNAVPQRVKPAQ